MAATVPAGGGVPDRALTQIKAVDGAYPLTGGVRLDPPQPLDDALADGGAVIERALAERLRLAPGDEMRLGERTVRVAAILAFEPDGAGGGFGLGPKTILLRETLEGSGLLAPGTLFDSSYRLDLPPGADLAALQAEAEERFRGAGARWRDAPQRRAGRVAVRREPGELPRARRARRPRGGRGRRRLGGARLPLAQGRHHRHAAHARGRAAHRLRRVPDADRRPHGGRHRPRPDPGRRRAAPRRPP